MSLAKPRFFRDDKGQGADPNCKPGNDTNDGYTDATANRTYSHLLGIIKTLPAGTIVYMAESCGWIQTANARITNNNAVTEIKTISFDGTHINCSVERPHNMTVGQITHIKGSNQEAVNGDIEVTDIPDPLSFKYLPHGTITGDILINLQWDNAIRFDGATIKIKSYKSGVFNAIKHTKPLVEYTDNTQTQHRMDVRAFEGIEFENIDYVYTGPKSGNPHCFSTYGHAVSSVYLKRVKVEGFRVGLHINHKSNNGPFNLMNDILVYECEFINNWFQGILGHYDNSFFYKTKFENNGHGNTGGNNKAHNVYVSSCHNLRIHDCDLSKSAMNNGITTGSELVVHGVAGNISIKGNKIHNTVEESGGGGYPIDVTSGYNTPENFTDIIIEDNEIINGGRVAIECNAWINGVIQNNKIRYDGILKHTGIRFSRERSTPGTPTSKGFKILNNYYYGNGTDIDVQAGTEYTIVRPTDPPIEPPIEPPTSEVEVTTTVQIKVDGVVTSTEEYITIG